jgi:nucleotide-binding universal stress UspA family protein
MTSRSWQLDSEYHGFIAVICDLSNAIEYDLTHSRRITMSYKSMTVCLDNSSGSSRRLDFALALAARHGAHLTGLHLTYAPAVFYEPYADWAPVVVEWERVAQKRQELAQESFRTAARKAGVNYDWASYQSSALQQIIEHARTTDLTILGQQSAADALSDIGTNFNEFFVLRLGRPVLFLPHAGELPPAFGNIVVAWDGGREAGRAMADAMPFLQEAKQVTVSTLIKKPDRENDLPQIDIAAYLARHDVPVAIERHQLSAAAPADWLLTRVADLGADLLVMGAYGHHRVTELVLGGMTRSLLHQMTIPVLMSH